MKKPRIKVDSRASSLLASIADAKDDPVVIAELADLNPEEFREFIEESGETIDEEANELLKAAEAAFPETSENIRHHRTGGDATILTGFTDPGIFVNRVGPFRLLLISYIGLSLGLAYGLLGLVLIWYLGNTSEAQLFWTAYTSSFKTIFSLGLVLGTAVIVFQTQTIIPKIIETSLKGYLSAEYYYYKRRFFSIRQSLTLSMEMAVLAFIVFSYCQFPLSKRGTALMLFAVCAEYALGAYVIRRLLYAVMMLYSLLTATVPRELFKTRELEKITTYVHLTSTLAMICVCVHVIGYYRGPFLFGSILGINLKPFLLLPALIATPLLVILHFYPRAVLQSLYSQSIEIERRRFRRDLDNEELSADEKRHYLIQLEEMSRNELRPHLKLNFSDLILGIAVLIMVLGIFLRQ